MSVIFDLTIAANELFDAVVVMDKSPAYAAFKEEIEKILADFNKTGKYWEVSSVDVKELVENSSDALKNMHKAFLLWTIKEEREKDVPDESSYEAFVKLFFKSQESQLTFLNEGKKTIAAKDVAGLRTKFIRVISSTPDLYNSIKEFFSGYVYGYFFNYLSEQKIMKQYAEFVVCLAIMSGKINASESEKQKILPKMAKLLNNDRFKYIGGYIPLSVMINIVCNRYEVGGISEIEMGRVAKTVTEYMVSKYEFNENDDQQFVSSEVSASIMSALNSEYIDVPAFAAGIWQKSFSGIRTFLDGDREDFNGFDSEKFVEIANDKCESDYDSFYTTERDAVIEVNLGSGNKGYKYPLVFKDKEKFWCSSVYSSFIYPVLDNNIYKPYELTDLPMSEFPFVMNALKTNIIRNIGGLAVPGYSVRIDKAQLLANMNKIDKSKSLSDTEKKMSKLEIALVVASASLDEAEYKKMLVDNVFKTDLYEQYIRFRMDKLFEIGMKNLNAKKNLLDELNKID